MDIIQQFKDIKFDWDKPKHRWAYRGASGVIILVLYLLGGAPLVSVVALYLVMLLVAQNIDQE